MCFCWSDVCCVEPMLSDQVNESSTILWLHFKGTWAGWWPGAADGQLGGSAFESQWHLQYGQSGALQAHRSQSPFSWRYIIRRLTRNYLACSVLRLWKGTHWESPIDVGAFGRWDFRKRNNNFLLIAFIEFFFVRVICPTTTKKEILTGLCNKRCHCNLGSFSTQDSKQHARQMLALF